MAKQPAKTWLQVLQTKLEHSIQVAFPKGSHIFLLLIPENKQPMHLPFPSRCAIDLAPHWSRVSVLDVHGEVEANATAVAAKIRGFVANLTADPNGKIW